MAIELYLARRYLLNRRHGAWGWLISWMATGSVAIGVASLIVTLAVMTGFRDDIRSKILGVHPHLLISNFTEKTDPDDPLLKRTLNQVPSVKAWTPFITGQILIGRGSQTSGAVAKGIDPIREPKVAHIKEKLTEGVWDDLSRLNQSEGSWKPSLFLGQELARNIGARLGDRVWVVTPGSIGFPALSIPKATIFVVKGILQTGLYDYDTSLVVMDLRSAQSVFQLEGMVNHIGVRLEVPDDAERTARELRKEFGGAYWVRSWVSMNQNLFSALKLEKTVMFIILTLVTVVASFMIVSNLLLTITQKIREIGILRAMGAPAVTIRRTFLAQGLLMGVVGNIVGVFLGIGISIFLAKTNIIRLPPDVYYIDQLPIRIEVMDIISVVVAAGVIVLLATLYPANRAAAVDPLDAIRYG